jgi:hypothetical protein
VSSPYPTPFVSPPKETNEIDVMPSKVIGLSQVLELFNIKIWVSGERAKVLFYLREVS